MEETELIQRMIPVIHGIIREKFPTFIARDYDEMYSAGLIAAWKAAKHWDANKSKWQTYGSAKILWAIIDRLRQVHGVRCRRSRPWRHAQSLSAPIWLRDDGGWKESLLAENLPDRRAVPVDAALRQRERRQRLAEAFGRDVAVLDCLLEERPVQEAMTVLGCGASNTSLRKRAVLERLRESEELRELLRA